MSTKKGKGKEPSNDGLIGKAQFLHMETPSSNLFTPSYHAFLAFLFLFFVFFLPVCAGLGSSSYITFPVLLPQLFVLGRMTSLFTCIFS